VAAPLLLAEPRYFPEEVAPRAQGVAVLLRRLPYRNAEELVDIRYEFNAGTRDASGKSSQ